MFAMCSKPLVYVVFLVNMHVVVASQCKSKGLKPASKPEAFEVHFVIIRRELNGSMITDKRTILQKSTDVMSDGKLVAVQPYINVTYNGQRVCLSFMEINTIDDKVESRRCKIKCSQVAERLQRAILIEQQSFASNKDKRIETLISIKVMEKAPKCSFCIGNECSEGKANPKQCSRGDKCYYMTIRDNPGEAIGFPTMGCMDDILFQRLEPAECLNGCSFNIKYGSWKRYVCTYCCNNDLCNDDIRIQKELEEKARASLKSAATTRIGMQSSALSPGIVLIISALLTSIM